MDFIWNEKTIGWFIAASEYTGFHGNLAALARPHVDDCETLCDIGCGLGLIDLELAKHVRGVVCVDRNEAAINALNGLISARGASNVAARVADANELAADERHDAVIMSFFGSSVDAVARFMTLCVKKMILIVHAKPSPAGRVNAVSLRPKPLGADEVRRFLTGRGASFREFDAAIEFGQPFKSREDARDFLRVYASETARAAGVVGPERLCDDMENRLVETGESDYPLYLPKPKELAMFVVDGGQAPPT
jgi:precorrin-6B methylase 2